MSRLQEERAAFLNQQMLALTDNDLKRYCPAVFAQAPHSDVSSRYGFVSSKQVVDVMREAGFVPTHARMYMKRNSDDRAFAKHLVRFRKAGDNLKKLTVGDTVPQIIMVNSHDRSSLFQFFGGLFRLVCSNGLMVSESSTVQPIVLRHTVTGVDGVIDACTALVKQQSAVFDHVDAMRSAVLTPKDALQFAVQALEFRPQRAGTIKPDDLLIPRRQEDDGLDVWRVYNRVQENLMRGGQHGVTANNRAIVTRGVDSINADLHINTRLWKLAMETIGKAAASSARTVARKGKKADTAAASEDILS